MTDEQLSVLISLLKSKGIVFEPGLTDQELQDVKLRFDVDFPPDLLQLLTTALPVTNGFVNWREGINHADGELFIKDWLAWPYEGMVYDIEHNNFWLTEWGPKPETARSRSIVAWKHFQHYPKLIPIYSHRYIPSTPMETGNPVFSIHQMDIIHYGNDLASYLANEFHFTLTADFGTPRSSPKHIDVWTDFTG